MNKLSRQSAEEWARHAARRLLPLFVSIAAFCSGALLRAAMPRLQGLALLVALLSAALPVSSKRNPNQCTFVYKARPQTATLAALPGRAADQLRAPRRSGHPCPGPSPPPRAWARWAAAQRCKAGASCGLWPPRGA